MRTAQLSRALDDVATRSLPLPPRVGLDRLEDDLSSYRARLDAMNFDASDRAYCRGMIALARFDACDEDMSK